jgi:hypothetical protein
MAKPIFMNLNMYTSAPELISAAYLLNPSHHYTYMYIYIYIYPPIIAKKEESNAAPATDLEGP